MKKKLQFCFFCAAEILLLSAAFSFDSDDIVSPVPGTWKNRQPLVLNSADDTEIFYSLSGTDPFVSGFSYDSPVMIDQTGDVNLKITTISKDGIRQDFSVEYSVDETDSAEIYSGEVLNFVSSFSQKIFTDYVSGEKFFIPENFRYSLCNESPRKNSAEISVSEKNVLERFVPFSLFDEENSASYHFVIRVLPEKNPVENDAPFKIKNWTELSFTDERFIYRVDEKNWVSCAEKIFLNRSVPHLIEWQDLEFSRGNEIFNTLILPMENAQVKKNSDGILSVEFPGGNFSFESGENPAIIDLFEGEKISRTEKLKVYQGGILQGDVQLFVDAKKIPAAVPEILYARESSLDEPQLFFEANETNKIYFFLSGPFSDLNGKGEFLPDEKLREEKFKIFRGEKIVLSAGIESDEKNFFNVYSFSKDSRGNRSAFSRRRIFIEDAVYYVKKNSLPKENQDGSEDRPFSSIAQFMEVQKNSARRLKLFVLGDFEVTEDFIVKKDCIIKGKNNPRMIFGNASMTVDGASLKIENVTVEKKFPRIETPLIVAKNSSVKISGSEIFGMFENGGVLLSFENSAGEFCDSGFTVQGKNFGCVMDLRNSKISVLSSRITSTAENAVNVKSVCTEFSAEENDFFVTGNFCYGIDSVQSQVSMKQNYFYANILSDSKKSTPFFHDALTKILADEKNKSRGF
jgi:hypothetical protein